MDPAPDQTGKSRKVRFLLYTNKDFAGNNGNINFTFTIQNPDGQVLWDSAMAAMKIKDIPDFDHKITMEKTVPGNNPSLLKVGFLYSIENVGFSWHFEPFNAGDTLKIVDYNFQ